ncbi:hypothetical protein G7Y79_00072g097470 [Physcia stellaris]|nr:hypothetical protein G7Y79_00072g097470 [Physcia stellaris]
METLRCYRSSSTPSPETQSITIIGSGGEEEDIDHSDDDARSHRWLPVLNLFVQTDTSAGSACPSPRLVAADSIDCRELGGSPSSWKSVLEYWAAAINSRACSFPGLHLDFPYPEGKCYLMAKVEMVVRNAHKLQARSFPLLARLRNFRYPTGLERCIVAMPPSTFQLQRRLLEVLEGEDQPRAGVLETSECLSR